ncbi:MAG TPA: energy-coupling factor ABC transporter ATP-binding protein, partial [Anaerolineales bacterium]|nr:energy-coupling factor ABC transporter ATP-binding protein [Anaerolineales bacterium]
MAAPARARHPGYAGGVPGQALLLPRAGFGGGGGADLGPGGGLSGAAGAAGAEILPPRSARFQPSRLRFPLLPDRGDSGLAPGLPRAVRRGGAVIEVQGLHVRYPHAHALQGVDLSIPPGSFVLIGGPSGGGKSTLAHALVGLIPQALPAEVVGRVSVAGMDPRQHPVAQMAARVGLVFQDPSTQLFNGTVEEEVAFGPRNLALPSGEVASRVEYALAAAGCARLRGRAVRYLSGGEQQRVAIAAALAMRPEVLILDEPTANLDAEGVGLVVRALVRLHRRFGATVVVIEHRLEPFLPHADRLVWLADGRVVADGPPVETVAQVLPPRPPALSPSVPTGGPLVALRGVAAGYNGYPVLRSCSLTLRRGEFAALVGPNGGGKTTLARVLAGVLRPRRGRVVWHANGRG